MAIKNKIDKEQEVSLSNLLDPQKKARELLISDVMIRDVYTVGMDVTIGEMKEILDRKGFHHLLVKEEGKLIGIVSDRDILHAISPRVDTVNEQYIDLESLHIKALKIMTRNPMSVLADSPARVAAELFVRKKISCVPVVSQDGSIEGIVTWRDLIRAAYLQ